ncbi:PGF-pre-PGF domain-containing protein [Candidatus Woesearchaeota archaeon]|nr:PGF-pre-PGF domain-containing protein [Candidatus Woesearchaeota archaeon]
MVNKQKRIIGLFFFLALLMNVGVFAQDTTPPFFNETPTNIALEVGQALNYDVNASDDTDLVVDNFFINDTTNFQINSTGFLTNKSSYLVVGTYWLNITANDSSNNQNSTIINISVTDTTAPTWNETPINNTFECGTRFMYDINASDLSPLGSYSINDTTRFDIDATTGVLTNNSVTPAGAWWLNLTINDSSNNQHSIAFNITVRDTTPPRWNETPDNDTFEYGESYYWDVNASDLSGIAVYFINDTTRFTISGTTGVLTNNSITTEGTWWINVSMNDTQGVGHSVIINITVVDTTPNVSGRAASTSTSSATISWTTDQHANSSVDYGLDTTLSGTPIVDEAYVTSTHSIYIPDLAPLTYYYNITTCDPYANCNVTGPFSFTIPTATNPGGGSSSSSSDDAETEAVVAETETSYVIEEGAPAPELPPNTAIDASQTWDTIEESTETVFSVLRPSVPVSSVAFTASKSSSGSSMKVSLAGDTTLLPKLSAKVYSYVEISKTNLDVASSKITFEVPKSWLSSNGVSASSVAMYRLVDGKWIKLETRILNENRDVVFFEAKTPGFSIFAIAAETESTKEQAASAAEQTQSEKKPISALTWTIISIIAIVILYVLMKPKKRKY